MKQNNAKKLLLILLTAFTLTLTGCDRGNPYASDERYQMYLKASYDGTYEEWLSEIKGEDGKDGKDGSDGETPFIGQNGNWWIGDADTGIPATGPKGDTGATGSSGLKGDKGDQGDEGIQGPQGEQGVPGTPGKEGPKGEDGEDGLDGLPGKSAYELYVEVYGYVGTEEQWLSDLVNGRLSTKKTYTIRFYHKETSIPTLVETQVVEEGSKLVAPSVTRENYEFIGWKYKDELWSFGGSVVTEDMRLYGMWTPIYYPVYTRDDLENMDVSKSYRLMNDIDLSGKEWTPIELSAFTPNGEYMHFDGNGYIIRGLTITAPNLEAYGLFGDFRTSKGMFENIILEDVTINAVSNRSQLYVGALFGNAKDETYLNNVKVLNASINVEHIDGSTAYVGLLSGRFSNFVKAEYVYSAGTINVSGRDIYAGGMIGSINNTSRLHFLRNVGDVTIIATGNIYLAGVVGWDATLSMYADVFGLENYGTLNAIEGYTQLRMNNIRNHRYEYLD